MTLPEMTLETFKSEVEDAVLSDPEAAPLYRGAYQQWLNWLAMNGYDNAANEATLEHFELQTRVLLLNAALYINQNRSLAMLALITESEELQVELAQGARAQISAVDPDNKTRCRDEDGEVLYDSDQTLKIGMAGAIFALVDPEYGKDAL